MRIRMLSVSVCVAGAACFVFAAPARAQELSGGVSSDVELDSSVGSRFTAGPFLGANFFSDEVELGNSFFSDQVPGSAFLVGLRAAFAVLPSMAPGTAVDPRLSIELEGKLAFSSTDEFGGRDSSFSPVLGWRAHAVLDLWQHARTVPFALIGGGGETVFGDDTFMASPDTDGEVHAGIGLRHWLTGRVGLRGDARLGLTAGRFDTFAPTVELHVGAFYRFGSGAQPAPAVVVTETVEPEPAPADTDGDGIADASDRCPQEAEVVNEIDDDDGCPEVDSDGDGLLGSRDACPDAAEDADGHEDQDGCPDGDNDADGIADAGDKCPLEPESANGYQDSDGCPDEVPEQVAKFTGTIQGIQFRTGSARIRPASRQVLNRAVKVLKDYPDVRIEISGHTDSTGSRDVNMELSGKRADYVKWYLVDKGIDPGRIETVGYGPDRPIGDNSTAEGRKINRRIEFRLLSSQPAAAQPAAPEAAPESEAEPPAGP